jgi:hypothetical protein
MVLVFLRYQQNYNTAKIYFYFYYKYNKNLRNKVYNTSFKHHTLLIIHHIQIH